MEQARITQVGDKLLIASPYHPQLVKEIRGIPGAKWNPVNRVWSVPVHAESMVRGLVRTFYPIEGEGNTLEYETIRVKVIGKASASRYRTGGVTINDVELFDSTSGYLDMRPNYHFTILDYAGGFVSPKQEGQPFTVEYTLKLKVRKDATWACTGSGEFVGSYEILSGDNPVDRFLDSLMERM